MNNINEYSFLGMECCNETSGVEQKGGTTSRPGTQTLEAIFTFVLRFLNYCAFRIGTHAQGSRILLREYEFHESLPKDYFTLL